MDPFISYILQFGHLNQQQIDFILKKAREITLAKDDMYWEAGKPVRQIGFVTEGVLRVYYYNNKGEEITRYFVDEQHLILSGHSIDEHFCPTEYLQAITDCRLVIFPKPDWLEINETIPGWEMIIQKITAKNHREKIARRSELVSQDATTRYIDFMEKCPDLLSRVPLTYIASYLGITPQSLSRIRKNIR